MKKNFFIAVIILFALNTHAQIEYGYDQYIWTNWRYDYELINNLKIFSKINKKKIENAKISGFTETIKEKGEEHLFRTIKYDNKGNCLSAVINKKSGKIRNQCFFTYSPKNYILSKNLLNKKGKELKKKTWNYTQDSLISESGMYRNGKEIERKKFSYNQFGNIIESEYYKKRKLISKTVSKYDSTRIIERYFYKKDSPDYQKKWLYTYYPNKSLKSSVVYKANGKVKYTYNYECKPDGQLMSKHKDTTMVCTNVEYDTDSNKTVTTRYFDEKGKPAKYITVYSKNRKMLQYSTYHGLNDLPRLVIKYRKGIDEIEEQIYYNNKGKEKWKTLNAFDKNNNLISETCYKKGKLISISDKKYNPQSFVNSEEYYNDKNELKTIFKYEYSF